MHNILENAQPVEIDYFKKIYNTNQQSQKNETVTTSNEINSIQKESTQDFLNFSAPIDYGYVSMHFFETTDDIAYIVKQSYAKKEKWLIFTDQIAQGKNLEQKLRKRSSYENSAYSKDEVVFIDADYAQDQEAQDAVTELSKKQMIANKRIIITTAVMDNGISFHDKDLRNIVIFADTEEEFIQMLGRKRQDGKNIHVFVCKRNKIYFAQRKCQAESAFKYLNRYMGNIQYMYDRAIDPKQERVDNLSAEEIIRNGFYLRNDGIARQYFTPAQSVTEKIKIYNGELQQKLLNDMIGNRNVYENVRKFCYFVNGIAAINSFAVYRLTELVSFYREMEQKIEQDEYAFVKQQEAWLSIPFENVEEVIIASEEAIKAYKREKIISKLMELFDGKSQIILTALENKELKGKEDTPNKPFFDAMVYFYERCYVDDSGMRNVESFKQTDRSFQPDEFNACMKEAGLPYVMKKIKRKFVIDRLEDCINNSISEESIS